MFDLHAVDLGWPVPVPSGHGFDHRESGIVDSALDAAVVTQGDFTGDEFPEELEVTATVASGLFGRWQGIFQQIVKREAAQVVIQTGVCSSMSRYSVGLRRVSFHDREASGSSSSWLVVWRE